MSSNHPTEVPRLPARLSGIASATPSMPLDQLFGDWLAHEKRGQPVGPDALLDRHPHLSPSQCEALRPLLERLCTAPGEGDLPYEQLGEYRLLRRLGQGGMGMVFLAEQQTLRRLVALKIVRPDQLGNPSVARRFEREAMSVARLRHPNIVTVYDAGQLGAVRYLAMEFVAGRSLEDALRSAADSRQALPSHQVVRWGRDLADALSSAHQGGVIHRDVKPSNVLITPDSEARLLDFGLARDVNAATITIGEYFQGSPYYASPEQVSVSRGPVTERSDIYSLGACLYECLTGRAPFEAETTEQVFHEILHRDPVPLRRLSPFISRDLETVIGRAIEKEPERRYASAAALRDDLDALLESRPIVARPPTLWERGRLWAKRNPSRALASALAFLLVVVGPLLFGIHQRQARQKVEDARRLAEERFHRAESHRLVLLSQGLQESNPGQALLLAREAAHHHASTLTNNALFEALSSCWEEHTLLGHDTEVLYGSWSPDGSRIATCDIRGRVRLWSVDSGEALHAWQAHERGIHMVRHSPDGRFVATASVDDRVRVWSTADASLAWEMELPDRKPRAVAFFPDGERLAIATSLADVVVVNWRTGEELMRGTEHNPRKMLQSIALQPGGELLASAGWDGKALVWDVGSGALRHSLVDAGDAIFEIAFHPDGSRLATSSMQGRPRIFDVASGTEIAILEGHDNPVNKLGWHPDGHCLATGDVGNQVLLWDPETAELLHRFSTDEVGRDLAFDPLGRWLAASSGSSIRLWDLETHETVAVLRGHGAPIGRLHFSPDGERLLSLSTDGSGRVWRLRDPGFVEVLPGLPPDVYVANMGPGGDKLALAGQSTEARIVDLGGAPATELRGHEGSIEGILYSSDGRWILTISSSHGQPGSRQGKRELRVWDPESGACVAVMEPGPGRRAFPFMDYRGEIIAMAGEGPFVNLWDWRKGEVLRRLEGHRGVVNLNVFRPGTQELITTGDDLTVKVWDVDTAEELYSVDGFPVRVAGLDIDPNNRYLAVGVLDGTVCVVDLEERRELWRRAVHKSPNRSVEFHPHERWLAAAGEDGAVFLLDTRTGEEIRAFRGHEQALLDADFSPDGRRMVTSSLDQTVRLWDVESGRETVSCPSPLERPSFLFFHADGERILMEGPNGSIHVWRPDDYQALADARAPRELTPEERQRFRIVDRQPSSAASVSASTTSQ